MDEAVEQFAGEQQAFWGCDHDGCDAISVEQGKECDFCEYGIYSELYTKEQLDALLEEQMEESDQATLDLVAILSTFKGALENLNERVVALEGKKAPKMVVPGRSR